MPMTPTPRVGAESIGAAMAPMRPATVAAAGTTFYVERRGAGTSLLLIHGGGEDSSMLAGQASVLADAGFEVITYDRRGTGRSGRDQWPGNGAAQHADDAATILSSLRADPAVVVGVSSGGIVGLQLAARHPSTVAHVVAWEPPVIGVLPGGASIAAAIMEPITAYLPGPPSRRLRRRSGAVVVGDRRVPGQSRRPWVRRRPGQRRADDPSITLAAFNAEDFDGVGVTIAVSSNPHDLIAAGTARRDHRPCSAPRRRRSRDLPYRPGRSNHARRRPRRRSGAAAHDSPDSGQPASRSMIAP